MYSRSRSIALALFLGCAEHAVGQAATPAAPKPSFTMSISLKDGTVKPGAEVQVAVDLTNTSGAPIQLWHARSGRASYTVQALDRDGKAAPLTALERVFRGEAAEQEKGKPMRVRTGGGYFMTIAPGETAKDAIIIQDQVDLSQPGAYTIQLERIDPATNLPLKSNTVTLTVAN